MRASLREGEVALGEDDDLAPPIELTAVGIVLSVRSGVGSDGFVGAVAFGGEPVDGYAVVCDESVND